MLGETTAHLRVSVDIADGTNLLSVLQSNKRFGHPNWTHTRLPLVPAAHRQASSPWQCAYGCLPGTSRFTVTGARSKSLAAISDCGFMAASAATNRSGTISNRVS